MDPQKLSSENLTGRCELISAATMFVPRPSDDHQVGPLELLVLQVDVELDGERFGESDELAEGEAELDGVVTVPALGPVRSVRLRRADDDPPVEAPRWR